MPVDNKSVKFETFFVAALVLISGSVAVYRQIDYMRSQDLGMNIDNNLVIYGPDLRPFDSNFIGDFEKFKNELMAQSGVVSVTATRHMLGDRLPKGFKIHSPMDPERNDLGCNWMAIDYGFLDHFDIQLLAGRSFDRSDHHTNGDEVNTMILNEAAVDFFHFDSPGQAIGQTIEIEGRGQPFFRIVGVVENFHQQSLKKSIQPIMLLPFYDNSQYITVKYDAGMEERAVQLARTKFAEFYPGNYFDYYFLEDHFEK